MTNIKSTVTLTLLFLVNVIFSQITVIGKVVGPDSEPIIGASVFVKDSDIGVLTDIDGNYSINVPSKNSVLVFNYFGYTTKEVLVGDQSVIEIILSEDVKILQEVVVTALGIKKEKAKLGYATQEVQGEQLQKAIEGNVASQLTGRVAGLTIYNKAGLFETPEITLRGQKTLVVIDGVPTETDFWNINNNDIESINVLKGTAAAALYGALGINGAIMITTKKGKSGSNGTEIAFNSSNQFQAGFIKIPEVQQEYGMGWNGEYSFVDGKGGGLFDDYGYVYGPKLNQKDPNTKSGFVEIPQWNSPIDPDTGKPIPLPWITRGGGNLNDFLRNQLITSNNLALSSKSDLGEYRISLSHLYQKGQVPNTKINSTTATVSGGLNLGKKLKTNSTLSYNRQYTPNYPSMGYGADNYFYNILLWMGPEVSINDLKNYWQEGKENIQQKTYNYTWYNNPWYLANEYLKGWNNNTVTGQTSLTYDIAKGLQFVARTGITTNNLVTDRKTPYSFIYYGNGASPKGNYTIETSGRSQIVTDGLLTWDKSLMNDKLQFTLSAGGSHRYNSYNYQRQRTNGLNVPDFYNLNNSISPVTSENNLYEKEVKSAYGYLDMNYNRMIYIGLTGRNDWTSALQKPYHSFFYPSLQAGLVVSEMISLPKTFTYLKLRGAWANVSTDPDAYSTLQTYEPGIRWDNNLGLGLPSALIKPDLKPNQTISKEYGFELKLFNNRVGIDATYFSYDDKNFLINAPVSVTSGYSSRLVNGDIVNRRGYELTLNITPIKSNLKWDLSFNYSNANRYIKEFYGGVQERGGVRVGERADVYRGWAWQRSPDGKIVTSGGRPQYIDHEINLGYVDPDHVIGISNSFNYKDFSFSFLIDGRINGKMYNVVEAKLYEGGSHPATAGPLRDDSYAGKATFLLDGVEVTEGTAIWDIRGDLVQDTRKFKPNTTKVKFIDHIFDTYVNGITESVLYDRTFAKLREATLSYKLPSHWFKNSFISGADFSIVGRNLAIWTKVPFMDPDGNIGFNLAEPTYRNIGFNLNCKF